MALTSEQLDALITIFRKENEDLDAALDKIRWNTQMFGFTILEGETKSIAIPDPYDTADDYHIVIHKAIDIDDVNIIDALVIDPASSSHFTIYSPREATIEINTQRKIPKFTFHT